MTPPARPVTVHAVAATVSLEVPPAKCVIGPAPTGAKQSRGEQS
jgi:hypothetical protein